MLIFSSASHVFSDMKCCAVDDTESYIIFISSRDSTHVRCSSHVAHNLLLREIEGLPPRDEVIHINYSC